MESGVRVLVIGTSGSGKTTTAATIAAQLSVPHIELDSLYWGPSWTPPDREEFRDDVRRILTERSGWVIDGNYRSVRELVAREADLIVWLDYPLLLSQWRLARRTIRRLLGRATLWNGNRELASTLITSRFEFFRWAIGEHHRLRVEVPNLCANRAADSWMRIRRQADLVNLYARVDATCGRGSLNEPECRNGGRLKHH